MPLPANPAPTAAEQIRSICARRADGLLVVADCEPVSTPVHHVFNDSWVAVAVPVSRAETSWPAGAHAVLELTDHAPLRLRAPVRSLVWLSGQLRTIPPALAPTVLDAIATEDPNPALLQVQTPNSRPGRILSADAPRYRLLRLDITSVVLADATGAESVDVPALLAARPDPLAAVESCWLQHLESAHSAVISRLAARLPARLQRDIVRLLGLDRYGVRLRIESDRGDQDVRLAFHQPVTDVTELSQAIRLLVGCPFANGLRARHG